MAPDTQNKVCLDVAVDHRIRRLFKPVPNELTKRSNHVSCIEARGWSLKRPHSETQVTTQLAGPAVKGGIAVALQQPRHNHPFEKGLNAVIQDCETLRAIDDIFAVVSCDSLNIRTNIAVVDLLPYVSEDIPEIDDVTLKESFRASTQIICDKEPDVLLCAGKIWLQKVGKFDDRKGDAWKFESIGVGGKFGNTPKLPVAAKIRHGERGFVTIRRVNGFHPSHAMNHHPHVSLLRQLQILIGAEACGMLRGDWEEEEWMVSPSQSPRTQSPGQSSTRRNDPKYLPYYQELYSDTLLDLQKRVNLIVSDPILVKTSSTALYKALLTSGLSESCNDATLILRQMFRLQRKGWHERVAWKNKAALNEAASGTIRFTENLRKASKPGKVSQFAEIIRQGAGILHESVMIGRGGRSEYELDLKGAGDSFLTIATNIETLLMDLLLEEEKALCALGQEEILSSEMRRMTLASAVK
ncbi:hypothetical protein N7474_007322 [Penicillium riverlandense]|uniref:uncharacterized protein n=1 Tax=Penicillium riverlandense TaxID=1903569 RepID=UPI00254821B3|nr:uncharacterized protein N7474_007322 [Penicillium riverlandense]KAJ5815545.1 hypothetical protein N7474_007322 [Penicillium riverlandense]